MAQTWADLGINIPPGHVGEFYTTCPQCSHKRKKSKAKCLSANADEGVWFCAHCNWSGSLKGGVHTAPSKKPWMPPTPSMTPLSESQLEWFMDRGISKDTLDKLKVFGGKAYFADVEEEREAIRFPYYDNCVLYSIKSRTVDKHFTRTPGGRKTLFGMDAVPMAYSDALVWVEGEVDLLSLAECHIPAVSVPDGAPAPNAKSISMEYLDECQEFIGRFKTHIIAVDNDEPGKRLEKELSRRLGIDRCKRVTWPEDCKDANDVLVKHGPEAVKECIDAAMFYPIAGVYSVNDLLEPMWADYKEGEDPGQHTGFVNLKGHLFLRKGEFNIVTGTPGAGKSSFTTNLAINMAKNHGWRIGVFPAEALPLHRFANSIVECYLDKPMRAGYQNKMTDREYTDGVAFVAQHFKFLLPHDDMWTVPGVLDTARGAVMRWGLDMIILDNFTEFSALHTVKDGSNSSEHIAKQLTQMRTFARNNGVHLVLVVHPSKQIPDMRTGKIPRPGGYSISGSSAFFNKADVLLVCHRPDKDENIMELHIEKVRFRVCGRAGTSVYFAYSRATGRFEPADGAR